MVLEPENRNVSNAMAVIEPCHYIKRNGLRTLISKAAIYHFESCAWIQHAHIIPPLPPFLTQASDRWDIDQV